MINTDIKQGQKFEIGSKNNKIRILTATSVTSFGAIFAVSPGTWESNNAEMFAHFNDKDFWARLKPYKEKIIHNCDIVFYRSEYFEPALIRWCATSVGAEIVGDRNYELSRTTVEYTEEK